MVLRPRTPTVRKKRFRRCPKCHKLLRMHTKRCRTCHQVQHKL